LTQRAGGLQLCQQGPPQRLGQARQGQATPPRGVRAQFFWMRFVERRQAARYTLPALAADSAIGRAQHMAESFRAGLFPFD
jgi:hypothetical protein